MTLLPASTYVQSRSIGGSDAAAVMGESRYKTAADVFDAIVGRSGPRPPEKNGGPTERGRALEDLAVELYERKTGNRTYQQERLWSQEHPFLHASPDRIVSPLFSGGMDAVGTGILEIKCPGSFILRGWKEEGIPREYYLQIQHYLFVLGLQWADFCALDYDAWDVWVVRVERDEQTIAQLVEACTTFWTDYVEQGIRPPDTRPAESSDVPQWPKGRPGAPKTRADAEWTAAMHELQEALVEEKIVATRVVLAKERVKELMGEDEEISGAGLKIVWRENTKSTFDVKAFREARPDVDLDPFYRKTATRPFNIYPIKEK